MATRTISVYNMGTFQSKLETVNKKAAKFGFPKVTYKVTGNITEHDDISGDTIIRGKEVELEYDSIIKIEGDWQLVAILNHTENLVKVLPHQYLPKEYRDENRSMVCDHCHTDRYRLETFVVTNLETDEYAQVGRNCLGDFLGIDAAHALGQMDLIKELSDEDEMWSGGRQALEIRLDRFLAYTVAMMRKYGWVSGKQQYDSNGAMQSTATKVWGWTFFDKEFTDEYGNRINIGVTDADHELAGEVSAWMRNLSDRNSLSDYMYNLSKIGENQSVTAESKGFAASAINAYLKENENRTGKNHLGTVGKKIQIKAKYVKSTSRPTDYGVQFRHFFNDEDGNVLVWSTAKSAVELDMNLDNEYYIGATVKDHSDWQGVPQTEITRAKVVIA